MELRVEFLSLEYVARATEELSFGRAGDIAVDDNRHLHRRLGVFRWSGGIWWVVNVGSSIAISVLDAASPSMSRVAPGAAVPLGFAASTVAFEAGGARYGLDVDLVGAPGSGLDEPELELDEPDGEPAALAPTATAAGVPLSAEQRELLVALAAPLLDGRSDRPTNRQLAARLGWTITKYNRKLDGLCQKFAALGVAGLHGTSDRLATDRRWRLATHAIDTGLVARG